MAFTDIQRQLQYNPGQSVLHPSPIVLLSQQASSQHQYGLIQQFLPPLPLPSSNQTPTG